MWDVRHTSPGWDTHVIWGYHSVYTDDVPSPHETALEKVFPEKAFTQGFISMYAYIWECTTGVSLLWTYVHPKALPYETKCICPKEQVPWVNSPLSCCDRGGRWNDSILHVLEKTKVLAPFTQVIETARWTRISQQHLPSNLCTKFRNSMLIYIYINIWIHKP